ncbi:MAG: NADPH-dependent oxidoreductase, partial [Caldilineaceae bacterium]|nr:NADPH-dependent oxidoreductase [Caldilineaceae bacterium]
MTSNSVIDLIHQHGSVRHYRTDPVPRAMVEAIVVAGQRSSTSSNLQMFSAVVVTAPETRAQLAELCGNQEHIRQAPLFIAWCADRSRLDRACELRGFTQNTDTVESFLVAAVDTAIAMQNATLAAESLGLGMCYIGAIRNNPAAIIDLLRLPRHVVPISGMTLGWPVRPPRIRPRLPLDAVLHWEEFSNDGLDAHLADYDRAMIATGIYGGRQVDAKEGEAEAEDYGWTEHSARRVNQPTRVGQ